MADDPTLVETARSIIDSNLSMTLASADVAGRPWPTPVYFASADYREFIGVSSPEARHSQNVSAPPDIGIAPSHQSSGSSTATIGALRYPMGLAPARTRTAMSFSAEFPYAAQHREDLDTALIGAALRQAR